MKLLKSNWRELVAVVVFVSLLIAGIFALESRAVSEHGQASAAVSVLILLLGGVAKFIVTLALAWIGLAITFPEANRFVVGDCFDVWWKHSTQSQKGYIAVSAVAVLALVAAQCMASS
jgi:type IV secretory pathway VirB2 component (pilin)